MKKMVSITLAIIFLMGIACAESDIMFNNISWLADETTVLQSLIDSDFIRAGTLSLNIKNEKEKGLCIIKDDETGIYYPDSIAGLESVTYVASIADSVRGKIAGYPVKDITLVFAYDGTYKLISVIPELLRASYTDVYTKMKKVYGEGEEIYLEEEGITSTIWKSEKGSAILLYTQSGGNTFKIIYGRLDAEDILSSCYDIDPDDVSGL